MKRWVLLDRDGVINQDSDDFIKSEDEWHPLPLSLEAIALLKQAGYCVGVATNQSGIARGLYSLNTLDAIHAKMTRALAAIGTHVDAIAFCPHGPEDACQCRKPKPGMLQTLAAEHQFVLNNVPYIGDSWRDIEAAQAVGATPILVLSGKGAATLEKHKDKLKDVLIFDSLFSAATHLIQSEKK